VTETGKTNASVQADIAASVPIGAVFGGYFNTSSAAQAFNEFGVVDILSTTATLVRFADFGGGDGYLTKATKDYIESHGKEAQGIVVDLNPTYLEQAEARGLTTIKASLEEVDTPPLEMAIGRSMLHYNPLAVQQLIVNNIYAQLNPGGIFVHSFSAGDSANCAIRSEIAALPSLGRLKAKGEVHFITEDMYTSMAVKAGFTTTAIKGYAPDNSWLLSEVFTRFNPIPPQQDAGYIERRKIFMEEGRSLIEGYVHETDVAGVILLDDGDVRVSYHYPVYVSHK
jgi:hypothetical protein